VKFGGTLNKLEFTAAAGALLLVLSGCGASIETETPGLDDQNIDVIGKIQTVPYVGIWGEEGSGCTGPLISLDFNGQRVTLKDAAGEIVGVTNLEGWPGEPGIDLSPDDYGYNDGEMCSWDFTFPDVPVDSNFYSLEFSDSRVSPPTITKEELIDGPVIVLE